MTSPGKFVLVAVITTVLTGNGGHFFPGIASAAPAPALENLSGIGNDLNSVVANPFAGAMDSKEDFVVLGSGKGSTSTGSPKMIEDVVTERKLLNLGGVEVIEISDVWRSICIKIIAGIVILFLMGISPMVLSSVLRCCTGEDRKDHESQHECLPEARSRLPRHGSEYRFLDTDEWELDVDDNAMEMESRLSFMQ